MINAIANPTMPEKGERYLGTVVKITAFGAFVSLLPGKDGLLHISKLRPLAGGARVENVEDVVSVGQKIQVEINEIDDRGKLSLIPVVNEEPVSRVGVRGTRTMGRRLRGGDGSAFVVSGRNRRASRPPWWPGRSGVSCSRAGCRCSPSRCRRAAPSASGSSSRSVPGTRRRG